MLSNKKILVVGSSGFIGSNLVTYFVRAGWEVMGVDIVPAQEFTGRFFKITDVSASGWRYVFESFQPDACINAGGSGNVNDSIANPAKDFELNVSNTFNILEGMRLSMKHPCRYIHISSAAVYGNPIRIPVSESDVCQPISPYGFHKWQSESLCREFAVLYDMPISILRPFSVFGPGLRKQLFWDIFLQLKENPEYLELKGTGTECRDFIFIDDFTRATEAVLLHADMNASVYNVANGEKVLVGHAASSFLSFWNPSVSLRFSGEVHAGNPVQWQADISRLRSLGYVPSYSFEGGMALLTDWLKKMNL